MSETLWQKFHVGQRVWCKDAPEHDETDLGIEIFPEQGKIYTIRSFDGVDEDGDAFCYLEEIRNPELPYYRGTDGRTHGEMSFWLGYFEPLREQNIEIFRKMCRDASQKVSA